MERSEIAIIIPCFNEEKTINTVVENAYLYGIPIIVDDKSTDKSIENLYKIKRKIIIKSNDTNIGYEKTLQVGFETAYKNGFKYARVALTVQSFGVPRFISKIPVSAMMFFSFLNQQRTYERNHKCKR